RLTGEQFEDLTTGEARTLFPSPFASGSADIVVFGRFAITEEGRAVATGSLLQLDQELLDFALSFVRRQAGELTDPVRCAEALYRVVVRRGTSAEGRCDSKRNLPFDSRKDPLDALAAHWVLLDRDPGADEVAELRALIGVQPLLRALISVG